MENPLWRPLMGKKPKEEEEDEQANASEELSQSRDG